MKRHLRIVLFSSLALLALVLSSGTATQAQDSGLLTDIPVVRSQYDGSTFEGTVDILYIDWVGAADDPRLVVRFRAEGTRISPDGTTTPILMEIGSLLDILALERSGESDEHGNCTSITFSFGGAGWVDVGPITVRLDNLRGQDNRLANLLCQAFQRTGRTIDSREEALIVYEQRGRFFDRINELLQ